MLAKRHSYLLLVSVPVLLALVLLWTGRMMIIHTLVQKFVLPEIEKAAGIELSLGAMEGSLYSSLYLKNITVHFQHPDSGQADIVLPTAALHYNLLRLHKGREEFLRGLSVNLHKGNLTAAFAGGNKKQGNGLFFFPLSPLPDYLPAVTLDDWSFDVSVDDSFCQGNGIFLRLAESDMGKPRTGRLSAASLVHRQGDVRREVSLAADLLYGPDFLAAQNIKLDEKLISKEIRASIVEPLKASLTASLHLGGGDIFCQAFIEEEKLLIDSLNIRQGSDSFTLSEASLPLSAFSGQVWDMLRLGAATFSLETTESGGIAALPLINQYPFPLKALPRCSIKGNLRNGELHLHEARCASETDFIALTNTIARFPDQGDDWRKITLNTTWQAAIKNINLPAKISNLPLHGGFVSTSGSFSGSPEEPIAKFTLSGAKLLFDNQLIDSLHISGQSDGRTVTVDSLSASTNHDRLAARASYDISRKWWNAVELDASVQDISVFLAGMTEDDLKLHGDIALEFNGKGPLLLPEGELRASSSLLLFDDHRLSDVLLEARTTDSVIEIDRFQARFDDDSFITAAAAVIPSAKWDRIELFVKEFSLAAQEENIALVSPTHLLYDGRFSVIDRLSLETGYGVISAIGSLNGEKINLQLDSDHLDGKTIITKLTGQNIFFDTAAFSMMIKGNIVSPHLSLSGAMSGLGSSQSSVRLDGNFDIVYDENGLFFKRFDWSDKQDESIKATGLLPLRLDNGKTVFLDKELSLAARVELPDAAILQQFFPNFIDKGGALTADVAIQGKWQNPLGSLRIMATGFSPSSDLDWLPPGQDNIDCLIRLEKKQLLLEKFHVTGPLFSVEATGVVNDPPILTRLLRRDYKKLNGELDLKTNVKIYDISWLAETFDPIRRLNGSVQGEFTISGPLQHPHVTGKANLSEGAFRAAAELPAMEDISLQTSINGATLVLDGFSGLMGGAPVQGKGNIVLGHDGNLFDIQLTGTDMLFYRDEGIKLRGNAALHIHGSSRAPVVDGDISLTDSRFSRNVDFLSFLSVDTTQKKQNGIELFSFQDEPLQNTRINIRIGAEKPLVLANNLVKGGMRPDLLLAGTGELPYLTGKIYLDETKLRLPTGRLTMESGLIDFPKTDPNNPELALQGSARIMGYDVNVGVEGTLQEPVITLSSTPPLSNEDLLLLVLTGKKPPSSTGDPGNSQRVSMVALYLGQDLLTRLFGISNEDDDSLLERLQLDIGRGITSQGEDTIEAQYRLADKIFSSHDSLYLTAEKDVWDDYAGGIRLLFKFY